VYNSINSGLPGDEGYDLFVDPQGNVWRGIEYVGVGRTDGMGDWTAYTPSNSGLQHDDPFCIAFDGQGNAWIGTYGGGLAKFDGAEEWTVYNTSNSGLPGDFVVALAVDDQENIWIGTASGLAKFDGAEEWTVYNTSNSGLPSDAVRAFAFDEQGNLWMATQNDGGLVKFDGAEEWTVYNTSNSGLPGDTFPGTGLAFDQEGNLWVGTEISAARFDVAGNWTVYNTSNSGLPNNVVYDFAIDDQGNIWMGTQGGGVAKFDGAEEWTVYNTSNSGLPHNFITGLAIDAVGNLWIGTGKHHSVDGAGVAVYHEGGVIPLGLSAEFASLTSATTSLGVTRVGEPTPLEVTLVFDAPLEDGKTLRLNLVPLGPELQIEHAGDGRYRASATVTPLRNDHYDLPVVVQTTGGMRYHFFPVTLDVYPTKNMTIYEDGISEEWTLEVNKAESDVNATSFVHSGSFSHAIQMNKSSSSVKYVFNDPEGLSLTGYTHLEFRINGGVGSGQDPRIGIDNVKRPGQDPRMKIGQIMPYTKLSNLGFEVKSNTWTLVSIPFPRGTLENVYFIGKVNDTFYIDDMKLVAAEIPTDVTEVSETTAMPLGYALSQNYPNPFNPSTTISYRIVNTGMTKLVIYDLLGRKVATLVDEMKTPGNYDVTWNARSYASGVYFCRIELGDSKVLTQKMMLMK